MGINTKFPILVFWLIYDRIQKYDWFLIDLKVWPISDWFNILIDFWLIDNILTTLTDLAPDQPDQPDGCPFPDEFRASRVQRKCWTATVHANILTCSRAV
jgi:hypothetical protein